MENLKRIKSHQLTEIEWDALRAALPCGCSGLPLVPGLLDELREMGLTYYELFVLKPVCTHDVSSTYYVLLGWQNDDDIIANLPYPWIFGIYAVESYRYCEFSPDRDSLPSFDQIYRTGLEVLRRENRRNVWKGIIETTVICLVASIVLAQVIKAMTQVDNTALCEMGGLFSLFGGLLGGLLSRRKLPKLDATSAAA